jgi:hypothetical protein
MVWFSLAHMFSVVIVCFLPRTYVCVCTILILALQLFKVTSGQEAIAMLKMSERVCADLKAALDADVPSVICVRQW